MCAVTLFTIVKKMKHPKCPPRVKGKGKSKNVHKG
jgi:hypothetical protein